MIYCESRSDSDVLNDLRGEGHVFLLGCPVCANMSLHLQKSPQGEPALKLAPTGFRAVAMGEEIERLKSLLREKEITADSWVGKYPMVNLCILDERNRCRIRDKCRDFQTVVTLCCDAGKKSIETLLPEKKVVGGMRAKGIVQAKLVIKRAYTRMYLDKTSVQLTEFSLNL
ncbi:MAG: hypothetical protein R6V57_20155 [Vicinamibacterales bacterium]